MKRWLKATLGVVVAVVAVAAAAVGGGYAMAERKMHRTVAVDARPIEIPATPQALERGKYLYTSRGCTECHGDNGAGRMFLDNGSMRVKGPHISPGPGSVTAAYKPEDWVRSIRHGVAPGGRPLMIMPSEDYNRFTDADLGALVAYVRSLPPVEGGRPCSELPLPVRALYGWGAIHDAAAKIDHALPPAAPVAEGVTAEHGQYVAQMCIGCHGANLTGGKVPGGPPDWPPAANLRPVPGQAMERYPSADAFVAMFRSGKRPDGSAIKVMPFESFSRMNDVDLRALHMYLRGLPAQPKA